MSTLKLVSHTAQSRLARSLALVALLLLSGMLSAEASHQHSVDDSRLECLLCQGSVDTTAAPQAPAADKHTTPRSSYIPRSTAAPRSQSIAPPVRGPPALS